jgi:hypothetical protein
VKYIEKTENEFVTENNAEFTAETDTIVTVENVTEQDMEKYSVFEDYDSDCFRIIRTSEIKRENDEENSYCLANHECADCIHALETELLATFNLEIDVTTDTSGDIVLDCDSEEFETRKMEILEFCKEWREDNESMYQKSVFQYWDGSNNKEILIEDQTGYNECFKKITEEKATELLQYYFIVRGRHIDGAQENYKFDEKYEGIVSRWQSDPYLITITEI